MKSTAITAWTDYPFTRLGDESGKIAPVRKIEVLSYDGDKYCLVRVDGIEEDIKSGYIYASPGRCGEVEPLPLTQLQEIEQ